MSSDSTPDGHDEALAAALADMSAQVRAADALRRRNHEAGHHQLASEEARFTGLLRDVAERGLSVAVTVASGRSHIGLLSAVWADYVVVRSTVIALPAITSIRLPGPARLHASASAREAPTGARRLQALLADLVIDRPILRMWLAGTNEVKSGELHAVGEDMVTLSSAEHTDFIPFGAIQEWERA